MIGSNPSGPHLIANRECLGEALTRVRNWRVAKRQGSLFGLCRTAAARLFGFPQKMNSTANSVTAEFIGRRELPP
jgi:hypothetical protein